MKFIKVTIPYTKTGHRVFHIASEDEEKAVKFLQRVLNTGVVMAWEAGNIWEEREILAQSFEEAGIKDWKVVEEDFNSKKFQENREFEERVSKTEAMTAYRNIKRALSRGKTDSMTWERLKQIGAYINQEEIA